VLDILADILGVTRRAVTILSGHHSRRKRIAVTGMALEAAAKALERLTDSGGEGRL
jgi:uncharacterized protein YggU (UPF0235/DUF167 family)